MFMVPATLDDRSAGFTAKGRSMVADQGQADESTWAAGLRGFDRHCLANPMGRRGRAAVGNHNTLALRGRREYADRDAEPALGAMASIILSDWERGRPAFSQSSVCALKLAALVEPPSGCVRGRTGLDRHEPSMPSEAAEGGANR